MNILTRIKNFFKIGGAKLGLTQQLETVTDDPRVAIPSSEYERIRKAKAYYANDLKRVTFRDAKGRAYKRQLNSLNITKMASRRLASIIFNEGCEVSVDDKKADKVVQQVLQASDFNGNYETFLEKWIALGSGCIRPTISNGKIVLSWAVADQVYPLNVNTSEVNEIAIAFKSQQVENRQTVYYTLLEFHQWDQNTGDYTITNELYRSTQKDTVGIQVSLDILDEYASLQPSIKFHNITKPLFAFYKNPGANNINLDSPLGLGIVDNAKTTVDAINRTHDEFVEEVIKGRRKILAPDWMFQSASNSNELNQFADKTHPPLLPEDETVFQMYYGSNSDDDKVTDLTVPIRVDDYTKAMNFWLDEFERETGLSQGTFTSTPQGIQTATEVVSNNSTTYQTRSSYLTMVRKNIYSLIYAILELAQYSDLLDPDYQWTGDVDAVQPNFKPNDGVFIDQDKQKQEDLQAVAGNALPKRIMWIRDYGIDDATADEWWKMLQEESGQPDPDGEIGLYASGGDDNDDEEDDTESDAEGS